MASLRSSILLCVLALALLGCATLAGFLPIAAQPALAADETGAETTTGEEPPPVVETPTEPETTTPETETPVTAPVTTPPIGSPTGESGGAVEVPKSTPPSGGSQSAGGGSAGGGSTGGGSAGGGGSSSGAASSNPTGAATTSPSTAPSRHTTRPQIQRSTGVRNVGGGTVTAPGSGGNGGAASTGGARHTGANSAPSSSGSAPVSQPSVSPQAIDEGASAVSNAATGVREAFAKALPTAPLKKIGDRVAAHIAGADSAGGGAERKRAADGIGTAIGAALVGSAVAIDRTPAASSGPIPFFDTPGGESGTVFVILILALLLVVAALVIRELRSTLGFGGPRGTVWAADETPWVQLKRRAAGAVAGTRESAQRSFGRFRRFRANAAAGLRSLF